MWVYRHGKISHGSAVFLMPVMRSEERRVGKACTLPVRNAGYNAQPKRKEVKRGTGSRMVG